MRIAIIGFGLIGGSIARSLRRPTRPGRSGSPELERRRPPQGVEIAAWSRGRQGPDAALSTGVIDAAPTSLAETVDGADIVILAAPPLACLGLLDELAGLLGGALGAAATITDAASSKQAILARADGLGLRFVGGHPMAGRETAGYSSAADDLFVGRPWVVVPGALADGRDIDRVEWLASACGALPLRLGAAEHDAAVAAISHVPLVVSAALAETVTGRPDWPIAATLAAGGWRDMTRLAHGDPTMGAGILTTNAAEVAGDLRAFLAIVERWLVLLEAAEPDVSGLVQRFEDARGGLERR